VVPLKPALADATRRLAHAGVPSARHDAEVLAAHVLGCSRGDLLVRSEIDQGAYESLIIRRASREPLQHLTGRAHFRHLELEVGPGVFVPRPETEVLAGWVIDRLCSAGPAEPVVVDLCTGSGAVALAVSTEVPGSVVHAVELDPAAHAWAMRNLAGSGVRLVRGDLVDALGELNATVDVVVANPPYIPFDAWESVDPEVRDHDPAAALWADGDGLTVIRQVERTAARLLRAGGVIAVEHADVQVESAPAVFAATGAWHEVRDHRDLAGRSRFVTATRVGDGGLSSAAGRARAVR
jgi:release factor glutamine methyltransferase